MGINLGTLGGKFLEDHPRSWEPGVVGPLPNGLPSGKKT